MEWRIYCVILGFLLYVSIQIYLFCRYAPSSQSVRTEVEEQYTYGGFLEEAPFYVIGNSIQGVLLIQISDANKFLNLRENENLPNELLPLKESTEFASICVWGKYRGLFTFGILKYSIFLQGVEKRLFIEATRPFIKSKYNRSRHRISNSYVPIQISCEFQVTSEKLYGYSELRFPYYNRSLLQVSIGLHLKVPSIEDSMFGNCWMCGRGIFSRFSWRALEIYTNHHKSMGFSEVIFFWLGLGIEQIDLSKITYAKIVNFEAFLRNFYGSHFPVVVLGSTAVGQLWLRVACFLYGKANNVDAILYADVDELVNYEGLLLDHYAEKSAVNDFVLPLLKRNKWLSIGAVDMSMSVATLCNSSEESVEWTQDLLLQYAKIDANNLRNYVVHESLPTKRKSQTCDHYSLCLGASGHRKLFVSTALNPLYLRIHRVSDRALSEGRDLDIRKMHLWHIRCMNFL